MITNGMKTGKQKVDRVDGDGLPIRDSLGRLLLGCIYQALEIRDPSLVPEKHHRIGLWSRTGLIALGWEYIPHPQVSW